MSTFTPELQVVIARVRDEVVAVHGELSRSNRQVGSTGSVSERVPDADLFVITPSGLRDEQSPEGQLLCDLDGQVIPDTPGSEQGAPPAASAHAGIYRALPDIKAIALFGVT